MYASERTFKESCVCANSVVGTSLRQKAASRDLTAEDMWTTRILDRYKTRPHDSDVLLGVQNDSCLNKFFKLCINCTFFRLAHRFIKLTRKTFRLGGVKTKCYTRSVCKCLYACLRILNGLTTNDHGYKC